ncbi:GNAT family N-acetyltransferase [Geodermatophilus normandii]|uniref:GNAT family N-acetyltransferase n=1 Tax=Geodermatophilus normandii TaxID=1137989 RepID=A0A6P0GGW2_9ACTN|nr:GNAT family N-acetyltransferase [Geodermatophilus normandii]
MTGPADLAAVRAAIDRLDDDVVALLARREELVRAAGRLKADGAAVRAPGRVEQVVARARERATAHGASPEVVERVYRAMIAAFVDLELAAAAVGDGVVVGPAAPGSAGEVLTLQRAAYVTEAQLYGDPGIPPLTETLEEVVAAVAAGSVLTATVGPRVVGAVRGELAGGVLSVGRLVVAPDRRGRGVGTALLAAVERTPGARRAVLFTGARSAGNLRLYHRAGYREERRERVSAGLELLHLAKDLPG